MNQRIRYYICCCVAAIALPLPCGAQAPTPTPWGFISVKSFINGQAGATGNGSTDDTAAINRAINAANSSTATTVYFPPGTYRYIGQMPLVPLANRSYRFYGDGPGVSIIRFEGNAAGINVPAMGENTLNVDGLTLAAKTANCGTAIYAAFSDSGRNFRTATIHNVEIMEARTTGGYWNKGIDLLNAQNTVIDKVDITGAYSLVPGSGTITGIAWKQSGNNKTSGLHASNLEIKFAQRALETGGWVEGVYLTRFELVFCGLQDAPVVDLAVSAPGGAQKSTFHLVNGHVQGFGTSVGLTHLTGVKISKCVFLHNSGPAENVPPFPGSMVEVVNCTDVVISQSTFVGNGLNSFLTPENGILLTNSHSVRIAGNKFDFMNAHLTGSGGSGSCIVVQPDSSIVSIVDNLFLRVRDKISDPGGIAYSTRGNN